MAAKSPPLIINHEIITAPSASVMAVLRQETAGRRPAEKALFVLADPVFSANDGRVVQRGATAARGFLYSLSPMRPSPSISPPRAV